MTTIEAANIEQAARRMATANVEAAPETEAIYLFPAEDEIQLIETGPKKRSASPRRPDGGHGKTPSTSCRRSARQAPTSTRSA